MPRKRRTIPWLKVRDGTYYVFWTAEDGETKRLSLRTTDSLEAQQRYAAFLAKGHEIFAGHAAGLTVSKALDQYRDEHVDANVIDRSRAHVIIRHLKAWFQNTLVREVDIPACRAYVQARRAGVVGGGERTTTSEGADSTIRRELVVLRAAAGHALRWKRITANDMPSIELPKEAPASIVWLTKEELKTAIETAPDRLKAFIQIAYYTAGRRHSIETLRNVQINLRQGTIDLRSPFETVIQRKSKKRRPVVPLFPEIRPVVERLMMESPNEWLFGDPYPIDARFRKHMIELGLPGKSNPHILRHSRATHLLQDGVSIYDVARLLGDTIVTVDRVYGHHSAERLAQNLMGKQA
jgi:integrase